MQDIDKLPSWEELEKAVKEITPEQVAGIFEEGWKEVDRLWYEWVVEKSKRKTNGNPS